MKAEDGRALNQPFSSSIAKEAAAAGKMLS